MNNSAFCFLNIKDFFVAWEVYSGELISVNATKMESSTRPMSVFEASKFRKNQFQWYANELFMDKIREKNFPDKNSRLTSLYFFKDYESAKRASEDNRWGDGFYDLDYLTEVEITSESTITKVDHEWIFEKKVPIKPITNEGNWIEEYWKGVICSSEPLWEYLVEGRVKIIDEDFRQRSFERIKQSQPKTLGVLEMSKAARNAGSQFGHIVAWVSKKSNGIGIVQYIINMKNEEFTSDVLSKIKEDDTIKDTIHSDLFVPNLQNEYFEIRLANARVV